MKRDTKPAPKSVDDTNDDSTTSPPSEPVKRARKPSVRKAVPRPAAGPDYFTTAEAADILRVTDEALRKRIDRSERKSDGSVEFQLGGNVVIACKFGHHWRYQINPR